MRLFELPFSAVDSCQLAYRVELRTEDVEGVYLQMWCRSGGASAHLLKLDLVFEGPGTCWIRDTQILKTPLA